MPPEIGPPKSSRRGYLAALECSGRGRWGELTALPRSRSWWGVAGCPLLKTPRLPSALWASSPTQNRRLGPLQHNGLDPLMSFNLLVV